jgi:hypothetical protein
MYQHLPWNQLSLLQQLNCISDTLSKRAFTSAIIQGYHKTPMQLLPWEDVALIVWGNDVTGDVSGPLRFHASKAVAQKYLQQQKKNKWTPDLFKEVD